MSKVIRIFSMVALSSVLLGACSRDLDQESYIGFLERQPALHKTVEAGGITYTFSISTAEAMALKDSYDPETKILDKAHYRARLQELQPFLFVRIDQKVRDRNIPVLRYNSKSNNDYEQRVMYYSFYAGNDIRMTCNNKAYPPSSYQYEDHQGLSPLNTMIMAFPVIKEGERCQVVFNDRVMNNLLLKADFNIKDIQALPALVIK